MDENLMHPQLTELANAAFLRASLDAIELALRTGTPVVVRDNGGIKKIAGDELAALAARLRAGLSNSETATQSQATTNGSTIRDPSHVE